MIIGIDIGGSHITSVLVNETTMQAVAGSFCKKKVDAHASAHVIIRQWADAILASLSHLKKNELQGIGIAMPGPFDYANGICIIEGVSKYHSLYGVNVRQLLANELNLSNEIPIVFENDASCFGLGEHAVLQTNQHKKLIAITLGTGFGATFINNGSVAANEEGVPVSGELYNQPYEDGIAEDKISARGIIARYKQLSGRQMSEVKQIADCAAEPGDVYAKQVFQQLGYHIALCLAPWIQSFEADILVIGGNIAKAASLFLPALQQKFTAKGISISIKISDQMEQSAIMGATVIANQTNKLQQKQTSWRKSSQPLLPQHINKSAETKEYQIYPFRSLEPGSIQSGYDSLAQWIAVQKNVMIDGFVGNDWHTIRQQLSYYLKQKGIRVLWFEASAFLKSEEETESLVAPFLGEKDDVWGRRTTLSMKDFFQIQKIEALQTDSEFDLNIIIGTGSALCHWNAPVVYFDLPKNELQYRMRAGSARNLGNQSPTDLYTNKYKRSYFVDWVVLNKYRQQIKNKIAVVADGQWRNYINWALSASIEKGLQAAAHNVFRVRPWFEAGAWGGQWMKEHIPSLYQDEINYAWSFELIVPENGIVFESDGNLLEVAFDWLMESQHEAVLGKDAQRFGLEFPIRFDFLDTFDGGNLSIQCHPSLHYIQKEFGENITQDETYYILDCKEDAGVYLGFQEDINPSVFKSELEKSNTDDTPLHIEKFVQLHPAHKHDLFLIPNGTIHSSGANNLVLEISATPYIFTFKLYDWLRLDLNGEPRPININRAFDNLNFERKGEKLQQELLSHPYVLHREGNFQIVHLPTHKEHFYDVHRIEFTDQVTVSTENQCHVLMLVEGTSITVVTKGEKHHFHYAETFVIPAAAESYKMINEGSGTAKVIKAFIK